MKDTSRANAARAAGPEPGQRTPAFPGRPKAGLRLTPQLEFIFDEVPGEAHEIEDILALAHKRDEELASPAPTRNTPATPIRTSTTRAR